MVLIPGQNASPSFLVLVTAELAKAQSKPRHQQKRPTKEAPSASEGFCEGPSASERRCTAVPAPATVSASSHMGFYAVAYGFQSSPWCPKDHYLGRCTVCLGTNAHQPCFDLSVCLQSVCLSPVCPSLFCPSDWLANPIACASFPRLTLPLCR